MQFPSFFWAGLVAFPLAFIPRIDQCGEDDDDDTPWVTPTHDLESDITISYDSFGVPHVYGSNLRDLAFAQGYVTAKDRLWQMDYLRRQGQGRLAELFGQGSYSSDLYVRTFELASLAEDVATDLRQNNPEYYEILEAYSAGVNSWLTAIREGTDGATYPPQILAIGYEPDLWDPVSSLVIDKTLSFGSGVHIDEEFTVWAVSNILGEDITADLLRPQGMDPGVILPEFFDAYETDPALTSAVDSDPTKQMPADKSERQQYLTIAKSVANLNFLDRFQGSNNWVISGQHTSSAFPLLANDTHQGVDHPATYYQIHLNTADQGGDIDAVCYGYAGMPFGLLCHNTQVAWGLTMNRADSSDLYQETVVGASTVHDSTLVEMQERLETIYVRPDGGSVADAVPNDVTLYVVPHHGPLVPRELLGDAPVDISVAWTGRNLSTIFNVAMVMKDAMTFEDIQESLRYLASGAVNVVFADIDGNIGYTSRSDIPIRSQLDYDNPPYMVMPGDGGYDWTGDLVPDHLIPWTKNPERGYVVTANNQSAGLLDDNDPLNGPYIDELGANIYLGAIYDLGSRATRIEELLTDSIATGSKITPEDCMTWQADNVSLLARNMLPYILDAAANRGDLLDENSRAAVEYLDDFRDEGYHCTRESYGCLFFHAWMAYGFSEIFVDETDPSLFTDLSGTYINIFARPTAYFLKVTEDIIPALDYQASGQCRYNPTNPYCSVRFPSASGLNYFDNHDTTDVIETRDEVLLAALSKAIQELVSENGSLTAMTWGDLHQIKFNDPAERVGYGASSIGPFSIDGGMFTVDVADSRITSGGQFVNSMDVGGAPSQRTVFELNPAGIRVWDVLPGGQSEDPNSTHFDDQVDLYINNQTRSLPFYPEEVAADEVERVVLPAGFPSN